MVEQKEATIELLKEKNAWLEKQLDIAKESSPDALLNRLAQRMALYEKELDLLSKDKNTSDALLKGKEEELQKLKEVTQRTINALNEARRTIGVVLHEELREKLMEDEAEDHFIEQEIEARRHERLPRDRS